MPLRGTLPGDTGPGAPRGHPLLPAAGLGTLSDDVVAALGAVVAAVVGLGEAFLRIPTAVMLAFPTPLALTAAAGGGGGGGVAVGGFTFVIVEGVPTGLFAVGGGGTLASSLVVMLSVCLISLLRLFVEAEIAFVSSFISSGGGGGGALSSAGGGGGDGEGEDEEDDDDDDNGSGGSGGLFDDEFTCNCGGGGG